MHPRQILTQIKCKINHPGRHNIFFRLFQFILAFIYEYCMKTGYTCIHPGIDFQMCHPSTDQRSKLKKKKS